MQASGMKVASLVAGSVVVAVGLAGAPGWAMIGFGVVVWLVAVNSKEPWPG